MAFVYVGSDNHNAFANNRPEAFDLTYVHASSEYRFLAYAAPAGAAGETRYADMFGAGIHTDAAGTPVSGSIGAMMFGTVERGFGWAILDFYAPVATYYHPWFEGGQMGTETFWREVLWSDDILSLGAGNDIAHGYAGNDWIYGFGGDDLLFGDDGNDVLVGGGFAGHSGNDNMSGGAGSDFLYGEDGDDGLDGGKGADFLIAGTGNDLVMGGDGNDYITTDDGSTAGLRDVIRAGAGDDIMVLSTKGGGHAAVTGEGGTDYVGFDVASTHITAVAATDTGVLVTMGGFSADLTDVEYVFFSDGAWFHVDHGALIAL